MAFAHPTSFHGIFLALGGGVILSFNDLSIKFLSGSYALHQIIAVRTMICLCVIAVVLRASPAGFRQLRTRRLREHLFRVAIVMVSNVAFFVALSVMPLADAIATAFISPVLVTLMSAALLREAVGPHRWAAVFIGLCGVMVMVRPSAGTLQPAAILVLISALCYAGSHIMTRRMCDTESAMTLNFYVQLGFLTVSAGMFVWAGDGHFAAAHHGTALEFLFRPWVWPAQPDWPAFIGTGLSVGIGGLMLSQAYRITKAALIAPFEYIGMPMAIFWGLLVFGTWPDANGWLGIALICGAGVYTLAREMARRKDVGIAECNGPT